MTHYAQINIKMLTVQRSGAAGDKNKRRSPAVSNAAKSFCY
jgi:hypothetical protein